MKLLIFYICSYVDHTSRNNHYNTDRIKLNSHWIFKTDEILVKVKLVKISAKLHEKEGCEVL